MGNKWCFSKSSLSGLENDGEKREGEWVVMGAYLMPLDPAIMVKSLGSIDQRRCNWLPLSALSREVTRVLGMRGKGGRKQKRNRMP